MSAAAPSGGGRAGAAEAPSSLNGGGEAEPAEQILRRLPLFAELSPADLQRLVADARRLHVPRGGTVMRQGEPGDGLYVLLRGEVEVSRREGAGELRLAVHRAGAVLGEMSLLEDAPRTATVRAIGDSVLLVIAPADFRTLLASSQAATLDMLRTVTRRLRGTEASLIEAEKLASLGTLAAGLAHELNNPAAAVARGARLLPAALAEERSRMLQLAARLGADEAASLADTADRPLAAAAGGLDAAEDALGAWLQAHGLPEAWSIAPTLAAAGWGGGDLDALSARLPDAGDLAPAVLWLAAAVEARLLADEVGRGAGAISGIVASVKAYAHLDRAPEADVDVTATLDTTLTILRGRIGPGIRLVRDLPRDLPRVPGYPAQLSQLWTNLIDNALAAMGGAGTLEIRARAGDGVVVVQVVDSGPGIPAALRERVFDPFFTTKAPGVGSGLGLYIARAIAVERHGGRISLDSRPGRTLLEVTLPAARRHGQA